MQITTLTQADVIRLLAVMSETGRQAEVDWVNRTIRVLSEEMVDERHQLSTGPMRYRNVLIELSGR